MKIGFTILCRHQSKRLPGKILKPLFKDITVLDHLFNQLNMITSGDNIIIGTSEEISDTPIVNHCKTKNYNYYRGSLNDVSNRFLKIAEENNFDYLTRINGDNLFISSETLIEMVNFAHNNDYDFLTNVPGRTFPYGMGLEIVKRKFYSSIIDKIKSVDREHVTLHLYNHAIGNTKVFKNTTEPFLHGQKLAIDTLDDFTRAQKIVAFLVSNKKEYSLKNISEAIKFIDE